MVSHRLYCGTHVFSIFSDETGRVLQIAGDASLEGRHVQGCPASQNGSFFSQDTTLTWKNDRQTNIGNSDLVSGRQFLKYQASLSLQGKHLTNLLPK